MEGYYQSYQSGIETVSSAYLPTVRPTINRTKVELKLLIGNRMWLLFVSYQSYQSGIETYSVSLYDKWIPTINRTKVELKRGFSIGVFTRLRSINRTKVELKRGI